MQPRTRHFDDSKQHEHYITMLISFKTSIMDSKFKPSLCKNITQHPCILWNQSKTLEWKFDTFQHLVLFSKFHVLCNSIKNDESNKI